MFTYHLSVNQVMANKEHPIPDGMKILTNEDLEKVDALETFEELRDREQHFKLHYSKDNEAMQEWSRKKRVVRHNLKIILK